MKKREKNSHSRGTERIKIWKTLRWRLTFFVFGVTLCAGLLTFGVYGVLWQFFRKSPIMLALTVNPFFMMAVALLVSVIVGAVLAAIWGKYFLHPIRQLRQGMTEVKNGNFKVQIRVPNAPNGEIGILVNHFNDMVRELDGIELFRSDFINNFSHEFKTPIVSVRGFAQELQRTDLKEADRLEYAKIIADEAERLTNLSTNVLELSKLENQQIVTGKTKFRLDEQLRQCVLLLQNVWEKKNIEIIPELDEVWVNFNEDITAHIWNNLLSNAIQYTPMGGTVQVTLRVEPDAVKVKVSDTGIGMSEEVRERIFEKFYQGDRSHHSSGYGIGLTMAKRAVKLCGGNITVESELHKGSCFTVSLPIECEIP